MTIGITRPERKAPRRSALPVAIIPPIALGICLFLLDRLSAGLFDDDRSQSRRLFRRLDADCPHPCAEWMARAEFCPTTADTARHRPGVERRGPCAAARSAGVHARSAAVARGYRGSCRSARSAGCLGRSRQLGLLSADLLLCPLWRRRP